MDQSTDAVAGLLEKAADVIEAHGHAKGVLHNSAGEYCAMGAMYVAMGYSFEIYDESVLFHHSRLGELLRAEEALAHHLGRLTCDIPSWNDREETTGADVIEAMRLTAKEIRNGA